MHFFVVVRDCRYIGFTLYSPVCLYSSGKYLAGHGEGKILGVLRYILMFYKYRPRNKSQDSANILVAVFYRPRD